MSDRKAETCAGLIRTMLVNLKMLLLVSQQQTSCETDIRPMRYALCCVLIDSTSYWACRDIFLLFWDISVSDSSPFLSPIATVTHTHPFNGPLSRTTQVSRYQRGKPIWILLKQRDSEWQWHQLGYMQLCTSLQADNHASTPPLSFLKGRMPFLLPNQQCQSTEGT